MKYCLSCVLVCLQLCVHMHSVFESVSESSVLHSCGITRMHHGMDSLQSLLHILHIGGGGVNVPPYSEAYWCESILQRVWMRL